jgi:two-component system cell cycle sensor histidine kinase/response regulator CckA
LEDRVLRSQKLESLGVLAGGVAHDFNNFLTPIVGNANLLLLDLPSDSPLRKRAEMIRNAANRATALTRQMLAYAGHGVPGVFAVDVSGVIREMSLLVEATASHAAYLQFDLEDQLPLIQVDSAHVGQVVMSLVANASDSLPVSGGQIEVSTGSLHADRAMLDACFIGSDMEKGLFVYIEVCDDGAGIAKENISRIFDPFFTTRFEGRGLGLAAVHGIIRGYHGAIELMTEPGRGTRIRVLFPAVSQDPSQLRREAKNQNLATLFLDQGKTYTALVVDDDEGSRDFMTTTLSRAGIRVLEAKDGPEAVQLFERWGPEIGAVVLDCTMPGFSGERVFEALREIRGDVQIILVSGYSRQRVADAMLERGAAAFLQKPFEPENLISEIRNLSKSN